VADHVWSPDEQLYAVPLCIQDTSFSISGTAFTCNSGDQTWTATKTG
jgi:spermidine/putrescine-binding protein